MKHCRICEAEIDSFLSLGRMPLADGFLRAEDFASEYFFNLEVAYCSRCHMVQLAEHVERERMFHQQYAYYSSTSARMVAHFKRFAEAVGAEALAVSDPFVVEIGSNDGILLQNFARMRHLGVEPSANVAQVALAKGVRTVVEFFDETTAREIAGEHGRADAIVCANVMCHIPDLHSVVEGVRQLLEPRGLFVFEDPYLGDIVEKTSYDQIYDEHAYYFSLRAIRHLVEQHDLEVVHVEPQAVHGGSMRYWVAQRGARRVSDAVAVQMDREERLQLDNPETFARFRQRVEGSRGPLLALLRGLRSEGKRVVGYGATAKSATVINYCGISAELLEFISDTTPIKQGKFSPGAHIPVRPYEAFLERYPDYALLFAWNHAEEIMAKEQAFKAAGGQWIVYVPEVRILG